VQGVKRRGRVRTNLEIRLRAGAACRGLDHVYVAYRYAHQSMPVSPQVTMLGTVPGPGGVGTVEVELGKVKCTKCGRVTWLPTKE
jgi:hypothetical protein